MPDRHSLLAFVNIGNGSWLEEVEHRRIKIWKLAATDCDTNDDGCDTLGHGLHRMQVAVLVVGMPPGVEIVVRTRQIAHDQRTRCSRLFPVNVRVIVAIVALESDLPVANDKQ